MGARSRLLLLGLCLWASAVLARHVHDALVARERLVAAGAVLAWRRGTIPAPRGRLLDRAGQPLAWTERRFDLELVERPLGEARQRHLATVLGGLPWGLGEVSSTGCLRRNLSPEEIVGLEAVLSAWPELRVVPRFSRVTVDYAAVRRRIGEVAASESGQAVGTSGWEQEHDGVLRGHDGAFLVMCDRLGNWLPGTWREIAPMVAGEDVQVDVLLAEMVAPADTAERTP